MMLARPGLRKLAGVALVSGAGGAIYYNRIRDDDGSVVIPTLQATNRVVRLAGTCVMMVIDYKTAGLWQQDDNKNRSEEHEFWEKELAVRQQALDKAQEQYATNTLPGVDIADRVEAKKKEKAAMKLAAELVAEADEKLAALGNNATSIRSATHCKAAKRLLELCHENRGVYIKVGQHLANLDYLIPVEYIETLSALYDDNPVTSYEDVCHVIKEDLGSSPDELFDNFDPVPIASASLAQVHTAYAKEDGRKLAVKVQHRGLRETSKGDIFSLVTVVRTAERLFEDFKFGWLADEIAPNLPKELDFRNEGRNAELAARHIQTTGLNCIIPRIFWDKTSARVLTMQFEEGFKVTDTKSIEKAGLKKHDVAKLVSSVFASQVFDSGHVHCDPHEANVLLRRSSKTGKPEMILVDHGLYKSLDKTFRLQYAALWKSLMLADLNGIKEACMNMGIDDSDTYTLFAGVLTARPFDEIIERSKQGTLRRHRPRADPDSRSDQAIIRGYAQRFLPNIISMLTVIPRQMILLLKMNDCLRHIDYSLGSPANTLLVTGHCAARAIYKDSLLHSSTWLERFRAWWSYFKVDCRIHLHEASLWWLGITGTVVNL